MEITIGVYEIEEVFAVLKFFLAFFLVPEFRGEFYEVFVEVLIDKFVKVRVFFVVILNEVGISFENKIKLVLLHLFYLKRL